MKTDIVVKCRVCRKNHTITVDAVEYAEWQNGKLIQIAMPRLSAADRELLISQVCDTCFHEMFPDEDEDNA